MSDFQNNASIIWFESLGKDDVPTVGGKNASLGEMIQHLTKLDVLVPPGFATHAEFYRDFLKRNGLTDFIRETLATLDVDDVAALKKAGSAIRESILGASFDDAFRADLENAYQQLCNRAGKQNAAVAVRSSATAEDLPDASFAGQQETFLNVVGIDQVEKALKSVFASLFTDRAISYRVHQGFDHNQVALSAGIQLMVRSDLASSGVLFTLDTESGFDQVIFVTGSYGLGELVVQGAVNPDEYYLFKPSLENTKNDPNARAIVRRKLGSKKEKMILNPNADSVHETIQTIDVSESDANQFVLTDAEAEALGRQACLIEQHYGRPMDIEWAKDGETGTIYIVQARPETVQSQKQGAQTIERYILDGKSEVIAEGRAIGQKIGAGTARVLNSIDEMDKVQPGDVLVTDMTDPDWEPVMQKASAIVTNRGGRTCHAAIIARELGVPAIVGCGDATDLIQDGENITVSCAEGDTGNIYRGALGFDVQKNEVGNMPSVPFKIMMNVANPDRAFEFGQLPNEGIGLARLEFIINRQIGVHPKALINFDDLDADLKKTIQDMMPGYDAHNADARHDFFVDKLSEGIATLAASCYPKPVIVRLSDFKSNEYANLVGGKLYEPHEENPMIGFRGASRYVSDDFRAAFSMECEAVKHVRGALGLDNVQIMIPFVRTVSEAAAVERVLAEEGLKRGENGLKVIMMCELPSNALLAEAFLAHFDGFSIGSNDLTQLTLGLDRDSSLVADQFDERDGAVKKLLKMAIDACRAEGKYIGICGQGPSDHPDLAKWLMDAGIESVSLNPDTVVETWLYLGKS